VWSWAVVGSAAGAQFDAVVEQQSADESEAVAGVEGELVQAGARAVALGEVVGQLVAFLAISRRPGDG
jgi:hypothetical protein